MGPGTRWIPYQCFQLHNIESRTLPIMLKHHLHHDMFDFKHHTTKVAIENVNAVDENGSKTAKNSSRQYATIFNRKLCF